VANKGILKHQENWRDLRTIAEQPPDRGNRSIRCDPVFGAPERLDLAVALPLKKLLAVGPRLVYVAAPKLLVSGLQF
jgi:hypothetical protein